MFKELILTTDDMCPENLKYFDYWDRVHDQVSELRLIVFTIANYKYNQRVDQSKKFKRWFDIHKDWIEIGVHGFDHLFPPEGERDDHKECIEKSIKILEDFLPERFLYRAPGFQITCETEPILKELGFAGIAHQNRIKYFDGTYKVPFNTHCCDKYFNPITKVWELICEEFS